MTSSPSNPPPKPTAPSPKKYLPLRRRCKAPCTCPLRTTPSNPEFEFEHVLNRAREVRVPTYENDLEKGPSKNDIGIGLIAKTAIPAGSVVFAEKPLCMSANDMLTIRDPHDIEGVLHRLARDMGAEWYARFRKLGKGFEESAAAAAADTKEIGERPGSVGAYIWHRHRLRAKVDDKVAGILGLKLAWVNHSCLPNCALTLVKRYPYRGSAKAAVANGGGFLMPEEPVVTCVVVKALKDIAADEEITISYFPVRGAYIQREMLSIVHGSFSCACYWCAHPTERVELTYELQQDVDILMSSPRIIKHQPAVLFQAVRDLVTNLAGIRNHDSHIAQIWAHCAVIAGFHSDIARAATFLDKAITILRALRPAQDPFRRKFTRWRHRLEDMPGFGASTRGMSTIDHDIPLSENFDILFMAVARRDEYLRVGQYRRLTDAMKARIGPRVGDATFMVSPGEDVDETREDYDWETFPDTYLRCRETAIDIKQQAAVEEVMKLLTDQLKDPEQVPPNCPRFDDDMRELCLNWAENHPHLVGELSKERTNALSTRANDVLEAEVSDTGSDSTITPYNQESKKPKKKKKGKAKRKAAKTAEAKDKVDQQ